MPVAADTWTDQSYDAPVDTAGLISGFSSIGPSPDLALKPDLSAPGGFVRSTVPVEQGLYGTYSGTSMASPFVAGATALLLEAKPRTPAVAVRDIFQNSADPRLWRADPSRGLLELVHRQGAGMIDVAAAIQATTRITPGKLELGESEHGPLTRLLTIANESESAVTYDLSHKPALSTAGRTSSPHVLAEFATARFSRNGSTVTSMTVPPHSSASLDVTITTSSALPERSVFGGYVVVTAADGGDRYSVPYVGVAGDYQSIRVLDPTENNFPWLAKLRAGFARQTDGASYSMRGSDIPFVLARFEHQARKVEITIADAHTGKSWHRAIVEDYMPKNAPRQFFIFPIDGITVSGFRQYELPNGTYTATVAVLKALGDPGLPGHIETWTSPRFTIARP